jgi:hypothetical protein
MMRAALPRTIGTLTAGILTAGTLTAGLMVPGSASAAAAGPHWSVVPSPNAPGAPDDQLSAVSCTRARACMAVGYASRDIFVDNVPVRSLIARAWNGRRWVVRRVPAPPGAVASILSGVSCASARACTAVGQSTDSSGGSVPLAEAWNGTTWAVRPVPVPAAGNGVLTSVSCASARACMAVGYTGNFQLPLAARWNGATWTVRILPFPPSGAQNPLTGVSCTSATACTAIGQTETENTTAPLAERWDGATWAIQHVPAPIARKVVLTAVSCTSATSCTAAGRINRGNGRLGLRAEHWNGTVWAVQRPGARLPFGSGDVNALSCTSARACTAVVNRLVEVNGHFNGRVAALVERWNGRNWTVQRTPGAARKRGRNLLGVSCTSARRCMAVGYFAKAFAKVALAERWNGRRWRIKPTPGDPGRVAPNVLAGVSCTSASACLAVGSYDPRQDLADFSTTLAERWNGRKWHIQAPRSPTRDSLLSGVSCTSATKCTAVGSFRTHHRRFRTKTLAERWNGRKWHIQATRNPLPDLLSVLQAVSCARRRACMAVGFRKVLLHGSVPVAVHTMAERWNGRRWVVTHPRNAPHTADGRLNGVSCTSARSCEAVGGGGVLTAPGQSGPLTLAERWNGRRWVMQQVPVPAGAINPILAAVSCTSAWACTAVGTYQPAGGAAAALVERWNGTRWAIQPFPAAGGGAGSSLTGVSCTAARACAAAGTVFTGGNGRAPLAAAWNGTAWVMQPIPAPSGPGGPGGSLSDLSCTSSAACAAAGSTSSFGASRTLTERFS